MKKILIASCIIFSLLIYTVSAENIVTRIEVIPTVNGEEVSVVVKYTDNTDMCGGSLNFVYNKEKLEIVDVSEGETIKTTTHFVNQNYAGDIIRVNWISTTKLAAEGNLLTIKFKLLDESFSKTDISIDSLKIADENGEKLVVEYEVIYQEPESSSSSDITTNNNHSSNRRPSNATSTAEKEENKQNDDISLSLTFKDINEDDWYYEGVKYVFENNLMKGISETEFAPQSNVTRAMLVTILYRLEKEPSVDETSSFIDVATDTYYTNAVSWAKQNGIVSGVSEIEFAPNYNITREQIATIMYRYAAYKGYDVSIGRNANILPYTDFISISEYAISPMQYAIVSGILKGKTETTLNPLDNATRAEIATILKRYIENQKNK